MTQAVSEKILINEVPRHIFEWFGVRVCTASVRRWMMNGLGDGRRLNYYRFGNRLYTDRNSIMAFMSGTAPQPQSQPVSNIAEAAGSALAASGC